MFGIVPVVFIVFVNSVQCLDWLDLLLSKEITDNPECNVQKNAFLEALPKGESWALQMLDASARIPKAITQGNRLDEGTYDLCVNIHEKLDTGEVKGKYCYGGLNIPMALFNSSSASSSVVEGFAKNAAAKREEDIVTLTLSVCIPSACSPSDLFDTLGVDNRCQTKNQNKFLDAGDVACLVFLVFIVILLITSTTYDSPSTIERFLGPAHKILLAFSIITNGSKIINTSQQPGQIEFLNGLRVLSMCWIIMGHRYGSLDLHVINEKDVADWKKRWYSFYVYSYHLAVDTFLFISGVLLSYIFLKARRKQKQGFNVFLYYLHRYLRLTPALAVLYLVQLTLVRRVASGPMYIYLIEDLTNPTCKKNWWSVFLYIQNYVTRSSMCLTHTWYLSVDMQFFIISPLLLLPMLRYGKKISYILLPILTTLIIIYTMLLFNIYNIKIWSNDYNQLYYYASHNRLPAWLIGIIFGAFLVDYQDNKNKFQIRRKLVVTLLWVAVTALVIFLLLMQNNVEYEHTRLKATFYFPLLRPTWALCLCWISYACLSENASFINHFLSSSVFQVLSRITYSTFLVHYTLMLMHMGYIRTLVYFNEFEMLRVVVGDICMCYFVGAIWTLAFESPMMVIERIIFPADAKRKTTPKGGGCKDEATGTNTTGNNC